MRELLTGMLAAFALVAALHFFRFGRRTGDRFFDLFALAFLLLAINSVVLGVTEPSTEGQVGLYLIRLAAFGIIVGAIWRKNRS